MQHIGRDLGCFRSVKNKLCQAREGRVAVAPARDHSLLLAAG